MGAYKGGKVYCHQLLTATLMEMNANFTIRPFYTGEVLLVPNDWGGGGRSLWRGGKFFALAENRNIIRQTPSS